MRGGKGERLNYLTNAVMGRDSKKHCAGFSKKEDCKSQGKSMDTKNSFPKPLIYIFLIALACFLLGQVGSLLGEMIAFFDFIPKNLK